MGGDNEKRKRHSSEGTVNTSTKPGKRRRREEAGKDTSKGNETRTSEPTRFSVLLSGVNADRGTADAGHCRIPGFLLKEGKDDSDPKSDLSDVYVIGTLASSKHPDITPTAFAYTAFWGDVTTIGYALATDPIMCLKLKLAHDPVLTDYMGEEGAPLAAKMSLTINGCSVKNILRLNEATRIGSTARDLYCNEISITIKNKPAPSSKQDNKAKKLQRKMEEASFTLDKGNATIVLDSQPCVHCVRTRKSGKNGHYGLPLLVLNGTEVSPRPALWIAPISDISVRTTRGSYVLANLAAVLLARCNTHNMSIKIKYETDPKTEHLVETGYVRLYQDVIIRDEDRGALTRENFLPGYTIGPPELQGRQKERHSGLTIPYSSIPEDRKKAVDNRGDMAVCYEDNNEWITIWNEHDELRYSGKHKEVKTTVETMDLQTWWKRDVIEVMKPLKAVLEEKKVEKDHKFAILSSVLVNTSSSSQLGTMHNMLEMPQRKKACKPTKLRTKLEEEVKKVIHDRLEKWNVYLVDKKLHDAHRGSLQYFLNTLAMMPRVKRAKYERFAQLLIHLPDNIINEHSSTIGEWLRREGCRICCGQRLLGGVAFRSSILLLFAFRRHVLHGVRCGSILDLRLGGKGEFHRGVC